MKPIFYGINERNEDQFIKVPCEKVNIEKLLCTFENNLDKAVPEEWLNIYPKVTSIYKTLYTTGSLPDDLEIEDIYLEYAEEDIMNDIEEILAKPRYTGQLNYHYEYIRSLAMDMQASRLKEYLDEECDFI